MTVVGREALVTWCCGSSVALGLLSSLSSKIGVSAFASSVQLRGAVASPSDVVLSTNTGDRIVRAQPYHEIHAFPSFISIHFLSCHLSAHLVNFMGKDGVDAVLGVVEWFVLAPCVLALHKW